MAAPTRAEIKQRVRDYVATYSGIGTDVTDAAVLASYPAFEVEFYGTQREWLGSRNLNTYSVRLYIYACEARDESDDVKWRADRATAEAFIDPLAEFIRHNATLTMLSKTPKTLVAGMSDVTDAGVGLLRLNKKKYAGFVLEFQLTSGR